MSYKKLSDERKIIIGKKANEYAKNNYKQISLKLSPDVADKFDEICKQENLSRPELIKKFLDNY